MTVTGGLLDIPGDRFSEYSEEFMQARVLARSRGFAFSSRIAEVIFRDLDRPLVESWRLDEGSVAVTMATLADAIQMSAKHTMHR